MCSCITLFFFFKQKTAYEMRISDWSSDVCSSDLNDMVHLAQIQHFALRLSRPRTSPSIKDIGQVGPKWAGSTRALARRRRRNTRRKMGQGIGMFLQAILHTAQPRRGEAATICDSHTARWADTHDGTARPATARLGPRARPGNQHTD